MEYVRLGKTGLLVSELTLGTLTFGNEADETASRAIMEHAFEQGINCLDTAHSYNKGLTEEIIGHWMGPRRHDIVLASKVFFSAGGGRNDQGLSLRNIVRSVETSLRRLQTDYLDLLYLHHWDEHVALELSLAALDLLVRQGKVLHCGVSNFSAWQTMKALSVAKAHGFPPIVCLQPMYNLLKRQVEVEILPLAAHEGLAVLPYNALGAGLLTGKYVEGLVSGRITESAMYRQRYSNPLYNDVTRRFVAFARSRNVAPVALALAWVKNHKQVTSPIVGARTLDQFKESLTCLDIPLDPAAREEVTALSTDPPLATDREP
jgi:aryl-alcohol dehydrogenase-like predicted oxidoreductase